MKKYISHMLIMLSMILIQTNSYAQNNLLSYYHKLAYSDQGQGAALVLLHAFPTDRQLWQPQQIILRDYFRVINVDLWGFGQSGHSDGSQITMADYAHDVKELLDYLHINKAIIAGESMGGYIALAFFKNYPESVDGLILSDSQAIADTEEMKQKREAAAQQILTQGTQSFIDDFLVKAVSAEASAEVKTNLSNIMRSQEATGMASALRGMAQREDTTSLLANTLLPILIITGAEDVVISPEQSKAMHKLAKNSQLYILAHAGHLANLEQPMLWNQAVINMFYKSN